MGRFHCQVEGSPPCSLLSQRAQRPSASLAALRRTWAALERRFQSCSLCSRSLLGSTLRGLAADARRPLSFTGGLAACVWKQQREGLSAQNVLCFAVVCFNCLGALTGSSFNVPQGTTCCSCIHGQACSWHARGGTASAPNRTCTAPLGRC